MMGITLLLGCAARHVPVESAPPGEAVLQLALTFGDNTIAGLAAMDLQPESLDLQALTPAGVALFTVHSQDFETTVSAPDPDWAKVLELLPFERDMRLILEWSCPSGSCDADPGRVRERSVDGGVERRWRGPGGPATVRLEPGRAELSDPRRRYTLVLVGDSIVVP